MAARRGGAMKVAVIDGDVSYPPSSGKRLRTLNLMLGLADSVEITYIARSESADNVEAERFLRGHGIRPILVHSPLPDKRGAGFYARLIANLPSPLPYSVSSHRHPRLRDAVQRHAASDPPDVWQLEWMGYDYCLDKGQGPVVLQAHNVDALIWQRYLDIEGNPVKRAYIKLELAKMMKFEERAFQRCAQVVAVSSSDAEVARRMYGEVPLSVVENGVDPGFLANVRRDPSSRTMLFLGALDWRPNLDAINVLLDSIWPLVASEAPDARLLIVGRNPPVGLAARVARSPRAELRADVEDVRPALGEAAALVVPLRIGGGSRLKILEALAAGLPVVSTTIGAEGLGIEPGRHFTRADEPGEVAAALVDILSRPQPYRAQAEQGRKFVVEHHDWRSLARCLGRIWSDVQRSHPQSSMQHRRSSVCVGPPGSRLAAG